MHMWRIQREGLEYEFSPVSYLCTIHVWKIYYYAYEDLEYEPSVLYIWVYNICVKDVLQMRMKISDMSFLLFYIWCAECICVGSITMRMKISISNLILFYMYVWLLFVFLFQSKEKMMRGARRGCVRLKVGLDMFSLGFVYEQLTQDFQLWRIICVQFHSDHTMIGGTVSSWHG